MYALVTGSRGFVGPYLLAALRTRGAKVFEFDPTLDIRDAAAVSQEVENFAELIPSGEIGVVFHLAAMSHVGKSWDNPSEVVGVNVGGSANLLASLAKAGFQGRFVYVSSAEVYGNQPGVDLLTETHPRLPLTPYAASKLAAEEFVLQMHRAHSIDVVIARPFNHIGPGQSENFLVSAIARRIADAARSGKSSIEVGNLGAVRDFLDVRDVVNAYCEIAVLGICGEIYNISSGVGRSVRDVVAEMIELSGAELELVVSPSLARGIEVPRLVGDSSKLFSATGFVPRQSLEATLQDVLKYWRGRQAAS